RKKSESGRILSSVNADVGGAMPVATLALFDCKCINANASVAAATNSRSITTSSNAIKSDMLVHTWCCHCNIDKIAFEDTRRLRVHIHLRSDSKSLIDAGGLLASVNVRQQPCFDL